MITNLLFTRLIFYILNVQILSTFLSEMSSRGYRYSVSSPASWRRVRLTTQRTRSTSPEAGKPASHAPPTRAPARRAGLSRRSLQLQRRHHALTPHTSNSTTFFVRLPTHPATHADHADVASLFAQIDAKSVFQAGPAKPRVGGLRPRRWRRVYMLK